MEKPSVLRECIPKQMVFYVSGQKQSCPAGFLPVIAKTGNKQPQAGDSIKEVIKGVIEEVIELATKSVKKRTKKGGRYEQAFRQGEYGF